MKGLYVKQSNGICPVVEIDENAAGFGSEGKVRIGYAQVKEGFHSTFMHPNQLRDERGNPVTLEDAKAFLKSRAGREFQFYFIGGYCLHRFQKLFEATGLQDEAIVARGIFVPSTPEADLKYAIVDINESSYDLMRDMEKLKPVGVEQCSLCKEHFFRVDTSEYRPDAFVCDACEAKGDKPGDEL